MSEIKKLDTSNFGILWDIFLTPFVEIKKGLKTEKYEFKNDSKPGSGREIVNFSNDLMEIGGQWKNIPVKNKKDEDCSSISLKLKNVSGRILRLSKLVFPFENGLNKLLGRKFRSSQISFLHNGYQSWSESRSYRLNEKPIRSFIQLANEMSQNTANLPSNSPGDISSEMFTIVTHLEENKSFIVGQSGGFNQYLYIRINIKRNRDNSFSVIFDFGKKAISPGETIEIDELYLSVGEANELQKNYLDYIKKNSKIIFPKKNIKGWCTWYCYSDDITPELIYKNVDKIKNRNYPFDYVQIDDGYEKKVGDWLDLKKCFEDIGMKKIAGVIKQAGYKPAIWIAPFIAEKDSLLIKENPEFVLKNERGKPIKAGFNPVWDGLIYYALDISNPFFEDYLRSVFRTVVKEWGFEYVKLDFMYSVCGPEGYHIDLKLSRSELLKLGMSIIEDEVGKDTVLLGCGMPLPNAIGAVDTMRIGADTADYWMNLPAFLIGQGNEIMGVKNSLRNSLVRCMMDKKLWLNDPECFIVRSKNTRLNPHERMSDINGKLLSGSQVFFSDDFDDLTEDDLKITDKILELSDLCYEGEAYPLDLMERKIPHILYNTAGFIAFFNFHWLSKKMVFDMNKYSNIISGKSRLVDVWSPDISIDIPADNKIVIKKMPPHSSRLFRIE